MFKKINKKVDRFMEQVKLGVDIAIYSKVIAAHGGIPVKEETKIGQIEGYSIHFDKTIKGFGAIGGISTKLPDGRGVIIVDNYFSRLSPAGKKFILYHEVGHLVNNHLDIMSQDGPGLISSLEFEMVADAYAYDKIGFDAINGLIEIYNLMKDLISENNELMNNLKMRIDSLKMISSVL